MTTHNITLELPSEAPSFKTAQEIWEMLVAADDLFVPALSSRITSTQDTLAEGQSQAEGPRAYFDALQEQHFIIARLTDGPHDIAAFMSFRPHHVLSIGSTERRYHYVTTVLVRPDYRGLGLSKALYEQLLDHATATHTDIATRTWSTNATHIGLLERMQFQEVDRIANDRGADIDTIYFVKSV